ncbi:MAG: sensor histidine kinase N-terminal domain-containing protein [Polaromonas sp.]|uniref:sensor histidine kinase n=1 Tax=Polaromonas sp. TaxID=1869339 RepID=UPI0027304390|nr:sensor histidine kinase [Polaromonas sp.]MDP1741133.1 sensor histidine kinase N-terminal domain-containing protein [Polaromonas sp.]MDP1956369.1 sensor histidine kinase N-terminal domain-containing protein [Polaromonas sp.]MDP3752366.1 sensor histidine kinase N-terminal domain-containing protein [Polaromonas sp.]
MLTPLLLLWPISLALTWLVAQNIAGKPFDRALEYNVQALSKLIVVKNKQVQFNLTAPAREILRADDTDLVFYQVLGTRGELISGEHDLPLPPNEDRSPHGEVQLREDVVQGQDVRIAHTWINVDVPNGQPVLVQVAETLEKRKTLATEIVKGVMVPQFVTLPLAVLLVWLALVRGIKPLDQLEKRIRARKSDDMSPLDETIVPEEVAPLVSSINDLLGRLKVLLTTQKRFLADAAHQLKTPLAGLRMQADLAQRETDADELKKSLKHIGRASIRATHTVNQLLALARAEATGRSLAKQRLDLVQVLSEAIQDSVPRALEKHIDLGYDGPPPGEPASMLEANPTLLKELVRNLLDNALNYTPDSGQVTVRLLTDRFSGVIVLLVEDSGPGIAAAERELVFQPFYRALGTNVDGSGLGLAIVHEIARQHGATVSVDDALPGHTPPGTRVAVRFMGFAELAQE